jgi:hypothetical protein
MNEPLVLGIQAGTAPLARSLVFILLLTLRGERKHAGLDLDAALPPHLRNGLPRFGGTLLALAFFSSLSAQDVPRRSLGWVAASVAAAGVIALAGWDVDPNRARRAGVGQDQNGACGLSLRWPRRSSPRTWAFSIPNGPSS